MDLLTTDILKDLIQKEKNPCISIYIPTFRKGAEVEQNSIRYKNAIRESERILLDKGFRFLQVDELLQPAKQFFDDTDFWNYQSDGLAVFITFGEFFYYRLPFSFEETIIVNTHFHIKPLLQVVSNNEKYFILSLDRKRLRLLEASRFSIKEVDLGKIPTNFQETVQVEEPEQLKFRTAERGGNRPELYNGPGYGTDDARDIKDLKRFFQIVDKGIFDIIKHGNPPLILAGVEYLQPIYRQANSYQNLLGKSITLNTDQMKESELHKISWDVVESYFNKPFEEALFNFEQLYGTERTSNYIVDILKAAFTNKIESLFINIRTKVWGKFNMANYNVLVHEKPETGDEDLGDLAAVQTLIHNGKVFVVNQDNMPAAKPLAAIFRY